MEIAPVPRAGSRDRRLGALVAVAVLVPVLLIGVVPAILGLSRFVIADDAMAGSAGLGRGALVVERAVPTGDLRVGDVISFVPPASAEGHRVTRRVVWAQDGVLRTRGDARTIDDPWVLADTAVHSRVVMTLPYVGYPFLTSAGRAVCVAVAALTIALATTGGPSPRRRRLRRRRPVLGVRPCAVPASPYAAEHGAASAGGRGRGGHRLPARAHPGA